MYVCTLWKVNKKCSECTENPLQCSASTDMQIWQRWGECANAQDVMWWIHFLASNPLTHIDLSIKTAHGYMTLLELIRPCTPHVELIRAFLTKRTVFLRQTPTFHFKGENYRPRLFLKGRGEHCNDTYPHGFKKSERLNCGFLASTVIDAATSHTLNRTTK